MWGSRLALRAIVVALAVPAVPASGSSTQPEADTLQVSSSMVQASAETPLILTVTAPASQTFESLRLTLSLPSGWTDIPLSPWDVACPNSVCELLSATSTQIVIDARLPAANTITLDLQATPPGSVAVSGSMIIVPTGNLAPGTAVSFEYESAQASSPGSATFLAWQSGVGGPLQPLVSSPVVMVTPIQATTTSTQPTATPTPATSTPVPPAAPSLAGGAGSMTVSPTPGGLPGWLPVLAVVVGLVLAAGTGGLLASRRLRRGGHGPAGGSIQAVPRTGPPPSVAVHYTGNRPALTVRIEPRVGATTTTIEETRP